MKESSHVRVVLKDVSLQVRIGLHPWEKNGPQRILVNLELFAYGPRYIMEDQPILNYDPVYKALKTWPDREHTLYIETFVRELLDLSFRDERVEACRVSVVKPDIFPEAEAVGVEVYMTRPDYLSGKAA